VLRRKKRKDRMKLSLSPKLMVVESFTPGDCYCTFLTGLFLIAPCVWPNSGFSCCVFSTLLYFTDNSIMCVTGQTYSFLLWAEMLVLGVWCFNSYGGIFVLGMHTQSRQIPMLTSK
jgi:formate/nitrite transporter FocA (FNT family)